MARNVEIKARVKDLAALRQRVEALADRGPQTLNQDDTFFCCPEGRLKLRRFSKQEGELIFYQRSDSPQPRESQYWVSPTGDPEGLTELLSRALGIRGKVRKQRTLYWVGQTRVHLDEVAGLGSFMELEVALDTDQSSADGLRIARDIMEQLGIGEDTLVSEAYVDLLERK